MVHVALVTLSDNVIQLWTLFLSLRFLGGLVAAKRPQGHLLSKRTHLKTTTEVPDSVLSGLDCRVREACAILGILAKIGSIR